MINRDYKQKWMEGVVQDKDQEKKQKGKERAGTFAFFLQRLVGATRESMM